MVNPNASYDSRELRLDEAAAKYFELLATGQPIDRQQFLGQYADLAEDLAAFLDDLDRLNQAVSSSEEDPSGQLWGAPDDTMAFIPPIATNSSVRHLVGSRTAASRYRLNHFIARGGMGEVWSAEDAHVGREIAIKRILTTAHSGTVAEERFLFESQIMGQLEHPGIVPLHDLCRDELGRLFSVMRLVNGCSLKERLGVFHATKSDASWPRQVEFRRLLESFVTICQAVAYAHSRGVLHRDIKPDNIMLGSYGEALLLDWGLAKTIDQDEWVTPTETNSELVRLSSGVSMETQVGTIMGSSSYMPPEMAAGHADEADQRTDVYLLGATLYELLTGRPPRVGDSQLDLITLARSTPPIPPRRIDARIPKPLDAICLRAMEHQSERRYESASDLANEIENYLANEPVAAYREPAILRLWRWCRRHRAAIQRVAVVTMFGILGSLMWISYRRNQELQMREVGRTKLVAFRRLMGDALYFAASTDPVSEHAPYFDSDKAFQLGNAALELAVPWGDLASDFPIANERPAINAELYDLLLVLANLHQHFDSPADQQATALSLLDRAAKVQPVSRAYYQIRASCLRLQGRTDEADRELAKAEAESHMTAQDWFLVGEMQRTSVNQSHRISSEPFEYQSEVSPLLPAIAAYQQALQLDPKHYWSQFQLARCYLINQRGPEAVAALGTCIALRPEAPWAYSTRGLVHGLLGQFTEADSDFAQALRLDAKFRPAHLNRGCISFIQNKIDLALAELDFALEPPSELVLVEAAFYRAQIHLQRGELQDSLRDCEMFLSQRPGFSPAHLLAAQIHFRQGDDTKGLQCVDEALSCGSEAFLSTDSAGRIARGRALRQISMGLELASQQRVLRLALREFESADDKDVEPDVTATKDLLGLAGEVVEKYTQRLKTAPQDIVTRKKRGWNYAGLKRYELAANDFSIALEQSPDDAEAHTGLGYVSALQGDYTAAELEAIKSVMCGANDFFVLHNIAVIYDELAAAKLQQRTEYEDRAIAFLERAVTLSKLSSSGFNEVEIIRGEIAFHQSLRMRPEFQRLIGKFKAQ